MRLEIWKDIKGYQKAYMISNFGRVKSLNRIVKHSYGSFKKVKEKILKSTIRKDGYHCVSLSGKVFMVHQLVAVAFLNHKPNGFKGLVVDHIDNNKNNNKKENLQLISHRLNCSKDKKGHSSKYVGVHWRKQEKKWLASIRIKTKKKHIGLFDCEKEAFLAYKNELKKISNED